MLHWNSPYCHQKFSLLRNGFLAQATCHQSATWSQSAYSQPAYQYGQKDCVWVRLKFGQGRAGRKQARSRDMFLLRSEEICKQGSSHIVQARNAIVVSCLEQSFPISIIQCIWMLARTHAHTLTHTHLGMFHVSWKTKVTATNAENAVNCSRCTQVDRATTYTSIHLQTARDKQTNTQTTSQWIAFNSLPRFRRYQEITGWRQTQYIVLVAQSLKLCIWQISCFVAVHYR